ncbi:MAG: hypothetical protein J6T87_11205 [Bacteroidales bacterium]|nr:hypothetical protein [Bacteroidales bacterium]
MEIKFKKVHGLKDLVISGLILIAGIGLFFVNKGFGVTIGLCALLTFVLYKSSWRREGDDTPLQKRTLEVSRNCKPSLMAFLEGGKNTPELIPGNEGGTLLVEVWFTADESQSYVQLSEYVELGFQKITDVVELDGEQTQNLLAKL